MHTFTAVSPTDPWMPSELTLLVAPVCAAEPSAPDEYVGDAVGVLLDEDGRVAAFLVCLTKRLDARRRRTLMPVTALRLTEGPILHVAWTEDQVLAQPRLDGDLQPHNRIDGGPPVESKWIMPARPSVVPPGPGQNKSAAATQSLEGALVGAAVGVVAGLAAGGLAAVPPAVIFFGAGAGLASLLAGAAQETAADASEMSFAPLDPNDHGPLGVALRRLEDRLRDPGLSSAVASGFVTARRIRPVTTAEAPTSPWREAAGWR